jgi:hypothetical protein
MAPSIDYTESSSLVHYKIVLEVAPWVSAATVHRVYRAAQDMILNGRDNRRLGARSLTLVCFVAAERREVTNTKLTLGKLLAVWNRTYPQWAYARVSTFATALNRAEMALRFPVVTPDPRGNRRTSSIELNGHHPLFLPEKPTQTQH